ncbi:MAG: tripartite tricarboxylate transporter TctB family protein [Armatimonadota bacterium]|nr:tripartite tricarboxylate transporter TctB family protein [Armatimonadota bacterium]
MTRAGRLITSAVIAVLAAGVVVLAQGIAVRHVPGDPGPRAFPVAAAVLVAAGAVAALAADLRRAHAAIEPAGDGLVLALATVIYLLVLPLLGFTVSTAVLLAGASLRLDRDRRSRPVAHALVAVLAAGVLWVVFTRLLDVVLPAGPWGC